MQDVINAADAQVSSAYLEIGTSGMSLVLVTITFLKPSFSLSAGVISALGLPLNAVAANAGTAVNARIKDGLGNIVVSGLTVGASAADIIINSTAISVGQTITLTAANITHS